MGPETRPKQVLLRDTATVKHRAARVDRRGVVTVAVPMIMLGGIATAYGFLEGSENHPSLKLGRGATSCPPPRGTGQDARLAFASHEQPQPGRQQQQRRQVDGRV